MATKKLAPTKPTEATTPAPATGYARISQACEYLAICRASIYILMESGELPSAKFGGARRIPWAALHEYGKRCTVGV